jgi:hypothetical protein
MEDELTDVPYIDISKVENIVRLDWKTAPRLLFPVKEELGNAALRLIKMYNWIFDRTPMDIRSTQWIMSDSVKNRRIEAKEGKELVIGIRRLYFDDDLWINEDDKKLGNPDVILETPDDELDGPLESLMESPRILEKMPIDKIKGYFTSFALKYNSDSVVLCRYNPPSLAEIARGFTEAVLDFKVPVSVGDYCKLKRELQAQYPDDVVILQISWFGIMDDPEYLKKKKDYRSSITRTAKFE